MTPAARERSQVRAPILFVSGAAWILLVFGPGETALVTHCLPEMGATPSKASLALLATTLNPPASLALGWAVMLTAMMAPLVIPPVRHVRNSSFARRRARAIGLFIAGYSAIWMAAGAILMPLALVVRFADPGSFWPLALVTSVVLVWQFSPVKQRSLNRGHVHPELAAFGRAADIHALRFGLTHGGWCVGSCWALMLWPMVIGHGHFAGMAAVAVWQIGERLDRPTPPHWRWRGPGKAVRIALMQARMRLQLTRNCVAR